MVLNRYGRFLMRQVVHWDDGTLYLLDQRALPAAERWLACRTVDDVVEAVRTLAVRGAPCIALAAAYGVALAAYAYEGDPTGVRARVIDAGERLVAARPTAVNLRWAITRSMHAFERAYGADRERAIEAPLKAARALGDEQTRADERIAGYGVALLEPGDRVLTHCNTGPIATGAGGTAGGILIAGHAAGLVRSVWVDETRPLLQGARLTAWELGRASVPYQIVTDSSVGVLMARGLVDKVMVGADRIARNGDVANKIGTYVVAALAARHDVPFYVAAPTSTLDPSTPTGAEIPIEERSAAEVTEFAGVPTAPAGAWALNLAFDITPAELVTAIVTERGILESPLAPAIAACAGVNRSVGAVAA